ncbi:MAG: tyrosine-type recombinase/integrase [Vicinamibacterales bacterium]|jgi:integrase
MGSVHSYSTSKGRRYRVIYRKPDHTQGQKRGFPNKREAELFLSTVEVSKYRGEFIDPSAGLVRIEVFGSAWVANRTHLKPSTFKSLESTWRTWVAPRWGRVPLLDIRHSDVQEWVSDISRQRSATTVTRAYGVLAGILDAAVLDRRIHSNPARGVKMPRKQKKRRVYLTHAQVQELAEASRSRGSLVYFLAYTGVRWGEAAGVRARDVDFERRRISIVDNAVDVSGTIIVGTPKTHRVRTVPLPSFLADQLASALAELRPDDLVFGDGIHHLRLPHSVRGWFEATVTRLQRDNAAFPRLTPHDLRHTAASLAIASGANVKAVQRMLGHASAAMTLDVYADLFEDDLDRVAESLESARDEQLNQGSRSPG